jgi:DNA-binding NtrC family response regulator
VDVRIIAATNRDPGEAVKSGQLREDLYYRLNVFPIALPPLRERVGDVELLAEYFLGAQSREAGTSKRLGRAALERLRRNPWPGNVRELANAVQRAFILGEDEIGPDALPRMEPAPAESAEGVVLQVRVGASIVEVERRLILATLAAVGGDKKKAAALLGTSLKTLYNRPNV